MGDIHRLLKPWGVWKPIWARRLERNEWVIPFTMMLMIVILLGIPYAAINHFAEWLNWSAFDPATSLDEAIPFIAWSIIPYTTLYLYYPAGAILAEKSDLGRRDTLVLYQVIFLVSWAVFLLFLIFPTEIHIRDHIPIEVREGGGSWGWAYGGIMHKTDMPWNAWPSLHIIQSLLIVLTLDFWWAKRLESEPGFARRRLILRTITWLGWIFLAASICTTKQHFVFDLVTGIIVGLASYRWLLKPALIWSHSEAGNAHTSQWE